MLNMPVSRGHLRNVITNVSDALAPAFDELLNALPDQAALHIDVLTMLLSGCPHTLKSDYI